jgi:threonine dehydrogenase-like Zn-dependent dehydrogenase
MKALVYHGPREVQIDDKPRPIIQHPEDTILRMVLTFNINCGHCWFCRHELWSQCDRSNPKGEVGAAFGLLNYSEDTTVDKLNMYEYHLQIQ